MLELNYRIPKGRELTDLELDDNFRRIAIAINSIVIPSASSGNPTGTILQFAPSTLPTGYLWANGQAVSRATYATLFTAIGTTYGVGDGVSTFNLPDFRGRIAIGTNPMGGSTDGTLTTRVLGTKYGAESVTIPHSHTGSLSINNHTVSITPSGTVTVNNYVGTSAVSVSVSIGTTNISYTPTGTVALSAYTPSGTIAINSYSGNITPLGTVTVNSTSLGVDFRAIDPHMDIISEVGHDHTVTMVSEQVNEALENPTFVADDQVYTTSTTVVSIDLGTQNGGSGLEHTGDQDLTHGHTASFTGSSTSISHGHTGTFTGDLSTQTGSFTGVATNFNHTHTVSSSAGTANLNHGHTASFTGSLANQTLTHTGTVTINSDSPSASVIQPSLGINFIIKY